MYCCSTLDFEVACEFVKELTNIHNLIPFQNWPNLELLDSYDKTRIYFNKWQLSSLAYYGKIPVGICTAFVNRNSKWQPNPYLYFHRLAVLPEHRNAGLGRALFLRSLNQMTTIERLGEISDVILQTPIANKNGEEFKSVEWFYQSMGFVRLGLKEYPNKIDSVMHCSLAELLDNLNRTMKLKIIL